MNGFRLGPFEVESLLGQGGMGEVWAARHVALDRPVAIKVLHDALLDDRHASAFRDEVRAVARLRHQGIVEVYDYGQIPLDSPYHAGSPYLVMARAKRTLSEEWPSSWPFIRALLLEVLDALAHAHAHGIVHLDLKPGNVLLMGDHIALSDFGVATFLGEALGGGAVRGSAAYMAPEQFSGRWREYGPATDLYALGTMAWRLLCGSLPFRSGDSTTLGQLKRTQPAPELPEGLAPASLRRWLSILLATEIEDRYEMAADAAAALAEIGTDAEISVQHHYASLAALTIEYSTLSADADWQDAPTARTAGARVPRAPLRPDWRGPSEHPEMAEPALGLGLFGLRAPPLVGREAERDRLWAALSDAVSSGQPRRLVVRGSEGLGRSRLCTWIGRRASALGAAQVLVAPREGSGVRAMAALWSSALGCQEMREDEVKVWLEIHQPDLATMAPALAAVINGEPMRPKERLGTEVELVETLARRRPVVICMGDVGDDGYRRTLAEALLLRCTSPMLVLCTASDQADLSQDWEADTISLGPLSGVEMRVLLERTLHLGRRLQTHVVSHAEGDPGRALDLIGECIARGTVVWESHGFERVDGEDFERPSDDHGARALSRVEAAVGPNEQALLALERAAVMGSAVDREAWRRLCEPMSTDALDVLEDQLLRVGLAEATADGWRFSQSRVRNSLVQLAEASGRRAEHHRRMADSLEGATRSEDLLVRAHHLFGADRPAEALDVIVTGLPNEADGLDIQALQVLYLRAIEALESLKGHPSWTRWRALLWAREASVELHMGRLEDGVRTAEGAIQLSEEHGWERPAAIAQRMLGMLLQRLGELERAATLLREALRRLMALGEVVEAQHARTALIETLVQQGEYEEAERLVGHQQGTQVSPRQEVIAFGIEALVHSYRDRPEQAMETYERAWGLSAERGYRMLEVVFANNLADTYRVYGDAARAEPLYERAIQLAHVMGMAHEPFMRLNLAQLELARGDFAAAQTTLAVVRAGLERLGRRGILGAAHAVSLRCAAEQGHWRLWEHHFGKAQALLDETGLLDVEVAEALTRASVLAADAGHVEWSEAASALAKIQLDGTDDTSGGH